MFAIVILAISTILKFSLVFSLIFLLGGEKMCKTEKKPIEPASSTVGSSEDGSDSASGPVHQVDSGHSRRIAKANPANPTDPLPWLVQRLRRKSES